MTYDHYIAVDWAQRNMAVARMTKMADKVTVTDVPTSLDDLKAYLASLRGKKILTLEETTTSHWLYVELRRLVDAIIICDPYRNKLLSEGAQNDKIDASKLVRLLRADLLKPVYHSCDQLITLRKLVSAYQDLVERGVRLKNQRSALLRGIGKGKKEHLSDEAMASHEGFIMRHIVTAIDQYESDKKTYEEELARQVKASATLKNLTSIPGIGIIGAVKIGAIVVTADRFSHRNAFHAYAGLVRLDLTSGGRSYGSRAPRQRRDLKAVFKTAALVAAEGDNCFSAYYRYLCGAKRLPNDKARHATARLIATSALGVMRSGKKFDPKSIGALKALLT